MGARCPWPTVYLDEVATIERDGIAAEAIQSGTKYVGLEHIDSDGNFVGVTHVKAGDLGSNKFRFNEHHILFGKLRPYLKKTARPSFVGICSTDIVPILPGPRIHRGFLFHFLRHPNTVKEITMRCAGANLPRLSPRDLAALEVPLPPCPEQRQIAHVLDKADAVRRKRKEAIALTEELLRSAFLEIVGPRARAYSTWRQASFESLASPDPGAMRTGPFGSDLRHSEFVDDGVAVLGIDNAVKNHFAWDERRYITAEKYERLKRYTVLPGDVIVTIMGTTGRSAVVPRDIPLAITTKHLASITLNRDLAEPEFVAQSIHRHPAVLTQIQQANRGAIMSGLTLGLIKSLVVPLPPIDRQRQFALFSDRLRLHIQRLEAAHHESEILFQSLAQRGFRGELTGATQASESPVERPARRGMV